MKFNEFFINKEEELVMKESRLNVMFSEIVGEDKLFIFENVNKIVSNPSNDDEGENEKNISHTNDNSRASSAQVSSSQYEQQQHQQEQQHQQMMANATTVEPNNLEIEAELCVQLANFQASWSSWNTGRISTSPLW